MQKDHFQAKRLGVDLPLRIVFPNKQIQELALIVDKLFKMLERVNDNAYKIELPTEYNAFDTLNVLDLSSCYTNKLDDSKLE